MNKIGTWSKICLLVIILVGSVSNAQSQDLFSEMDQVKKDLSNLKDEVARLRNLVYELRDSVLGSAVPLAQRQPEQKPPKDEAVKPEPQVNEEEMTKTICQGVGIFFKEVDASLRSGTAASEERMRKAFDDLNSMLQKYSRTHRATKLLGIYQGLAWDTYVAVQLRGSVQGNEEFLKTIERHKRKYAETCPK
jgi:hypothetical protein